MRPGRPRRTLAPAGSPGSRPPASSALGAGEACPLAWAPARRAASLEISSRLSARRGDEAAGARRNRRNARESGSRSILAQFLDATARAWNCSLCSTTWPRRKSATRAAGFNRSSAAGRLRGGREDGPDVVAVSPPRSTQAPEVPSRDDARLGARHLFGAAAGGSGARRRRERRHPRGLTIVVGGDFVRRGAFSFRPSRRGSASPSWSPTCSTSTSFPTFAPARRWAEARAFTSLVCPSSPSGRLSRVPREAPSLRGRCSSARSLGCPRPGRRSIGSRGALWAALISGGSAKPA